MSIDFKDAYVSILVMECLIKLFQFEYQGTLHEFICLSNGLTSAPRLFTKLIKTPLAHIRQNTDINITGYLDDTSLMGDSPESLQKGGAKAGELFQSLGSAINTEKSVLTATQEIEFWGFIINSVVMKIQLSQGKSEKVK